MDANVRNTINEYFKSKPIQKAWVFGSVARGEEHPDSDVAVLIKLVFINGGGGIVFRAEEGARYLAFFSHQSVTSTLQDE